MLVFERDKCPEISETLFCVEIKLAYLPDKTVPDMVIIISNHANPISKTLENEYALTLLKMAIKNITQLQNSQQ